jgi:hypothetical protein
MDFTNMNMNTGFFSWIISADIFVLLKIYGYEYEYAKILFMGSPNSVTFYVYILPIILSYIAVVFSPHMHSLLFIV